ncbi:Uncharacterised protein [Bordetella pertussis]|nr:Uncharacterised protein [Bordetella pertussis]CFO32721.1 Uncharacterised protein [Bordetella pertussis]CFO99095.1 Uncharacterised protein [Bordetella pertussis]CPJ24248.1 Uncharacterised protein [Bordetella pertussis]CPO23262.1 Uncharacterised protein [Bordetella pertussis]
MKLPAGGITSRLWPGCSSWLAQLENTPSSTFLMATRSTPSPGAEQMEYERRTSSPSRRVRRVRYWPGRKRKSPASSGGRSNVTTTASRVLRATEATFSIWNGLWLMARAFSGA